MALTLDKQLEQRRAALMIGNRIRYDNALIKAEIGQLDTVNALRWVATIIRTSQRPQSTESLYVRQLIGAITSIGPKRITRWCLLSMAPGDKRLGSLSGRQREALAGHLDDCADFKSTNKGGQ